MNVEEPHSEQSGAHVPAIRHSAGDPAWVMGLHAAACRRWLAYDPPAMNEVFLTLDKLEGRVRPAGLGAPSVGAVAAGRAGRERRIDQVE